MGLPRAIEEHTKNLRQDDLDALKNYAAGVNKVRDNIVAYPREFMILWTNFEEWTPKDSVSVEQLIILFVSTDWFIELLRERLLEVYDKELVDRLLPYKKEDYFYYPNMETITDEELQRINYPEPENDLYHMD